MVRRSGVVGAAVRRRTLFGFRCDDLESIWTACSMRACYVDARGFNATDCASTSLLYDVLYCLRSTCPTVAHC